jgi:very-short-patch-repair endonuclease/predicted transcriptional regulator of viral defense system
MRQKSVTVPIGVRIAGLAAHQHGVLSRKQLCALGLDDAAIARRVKDGRLHRVHRGVYAVGHGDLTTHGRFLAAVLSCGAGAALSHQAAAVLWGLRKPQGPRIDVTVPPSGGRSRRRLLIVHRSPLEPEEVVVKEAIPVTSPARTLVDLAGVLTRRQLERTIDEAEFLGLHVDAPLTRRGSRGVALLRAVLEEHNAGSTWTRSELEERMLALCRRAGLPAPLVNQVVAGWEVDFLWPDQRLAVETDGWSSHRGRGAFERDRLRDAALVEAGWRVVRITRARLARDPQGVAAQLARLLGA